MNTHTHEQLESIAAARFERRSLNDWLLSRRECVDDPEALLSALVDLLRPVFVYLADGYKNGVLERRAWTLLYAMRPDLIDGEDMSTFAARQGVTKPAIHAQLAHLRNALPGLRIDTDTRKGHALDKAVSSLRKAEGQRRRGRRRAGCFRGMCERLEAAA
ncbi:MAG: hypothetical protein LBC18_03545 [Opitutaceae bacterium]|jgi:hypothetical protein|nr:hypothetical protein [Opitutaceae bacterium]